jgi:mannose/fructose/N-acetylgalactosamine-specific phosphotransferase system component IID
VNVEMLDFLKPDFVHPTPQQVGRYFRWFGWAGFWLQALLGFIPILVLITTALTRPGSTFTFGLLLAMLCLLILCFSIYWCFRYVQVGNNLVRPNTRPSKAGVLRDLRLGLTANLGMMVLAVLIALVRVAELTIRMLTLPQGATVIAPTQVGGTAIAPGAFITPSNMIAIQAMINTIAAGLVGTIVALLLLYVVRQHRNVDEF